MESILVPTSGQYIDEGSEVSLERFPTLVWTLRYGKYSYRGSNYSGWYFYIEKSRTTLPMNFRDLTSLTVVGQTDVPSGVEYPEPVELHPYVDCLGIDYAYITPEEKARYDAAFITVDTLEDRDVIYPVPDGKIVRVNDVDGAIIYYVYNRTAQEWSTINIDPDLTPYATIEYVDAKDNDIQTQIDEIHESITWTVI